MSEVARITVDMEQLNGYEFNVRFNWGNVPELMMDEPRPHGGRNGPNASRLLAASIGNCLCCSLMYCLAKDQVPSESVKARVTTHVVRNERGRVRIGSLGVTITINEEIEKSQRLNRCLEVFQDYCTISESVREGIPINVDIVNRAGDRLRTRQLSP